MSSRVVLISLMVLCLGCTGTRCDSIMGICCPAKPCENNGICMTLQGSSTCACASGFGGEFCEINLNPTTMPTSSPNANPTCFPASSSVTVSDGSTLPIAELKIGDEVLAYQHGTNKPHYSTVVAFLDYQSFTSTEYLRIFTANSTAISISPLHLIPVMRDCVQQFVQARYVQPNDELIVHGKDAFRLERVASVASLLDKGAYAPMTEAGTIVVDGVVASCYSIVDSHQLAHWVLAPLRWWSSIKHMFGESREEAGEGIHTFANWLYHSFGDHAVLAESPRLLLG